ncbi:translocation/assembly module TamB [Myxococcota bacterium]|nr:translocation/assembly module TamB [Myxococcota bacterium]
MPGGTRARRLGRAVGRAACALLALTALALGVAVALLSTDRDLDFVVRRLVPRVDEAIPGSVGIGGAWGAPLAGRLTLRDVVLRDPEGGEVLRVAEVDLRIRPRPLLAGGLVVERLHLRSPVLSLALGPGGWNVVRAVSPPGEADDGGAGDLPFDVALESLSIQDGTVEVEGLGAPVRAADLEVHGGAVLSRALDDLRLSVVASARAVEPALGRLALGATGRAAPGRVALDAVDLDWEGSRWVAWGALDGVDLLPRPGGGGATSPLAVDLKAGVRGLPLRRLAAFGWDAPDLTVDARGRARGPLQALDVSLAAEVPEQDATAEADLALLGSEVRAHRLVLRSRLGDADLSGSVDPGASRFRARGRISVPEIARWEPVAGAVRGVRGAVRARFDAEGGWGGEGEGLEAVDLRAEGRLDSDGLSVSGQVPLDLGGSFDVRLARGEASGGGDLYLRPGGRDFPVVEGRVRASGRRVDFDLAGRDGEGNDVDVAGRLSWSAARLDLALSRLALRWREVALASRGKVEASYAFRSRAVTVGRLALHSPLRPDLSARVEGRFTAGESVDARVEVASLPVSWLAPALPGDLPLAPEGTVGLAVTARGPLGAPRLSVELRLSGVHAVGAPPADLGVRADAAEGRTRIDADLAAPGRDPVRLEADLPVAVRLDGGPDLDPGGAIRVRLDLPRQALDGLVRLAGGPPPGEPLGEIGGRATLGGTPARPELELDVLYGVPEGLGLGAEVSTVEARLAAEPRDGGAALSGDLAFDGERRFGLAGSLTGRPGEWLVAALGGRPPGAVPVDALEARATVERIPLAALAGLALGGAEASGWLGGEIDVAWDGRLPRGRADLRVEGGRIAGISFGEARFWAEAGADGLSGAADLATLPGGSLSARARVPLGLPPPPGTDVGAALRGAALEARIDARALPVALAAAFVPELEGAQGTVSVRGDVGGTVAEPLPDLRLSTDGISLCLAGLGTCWTEVAAAARLAPGELGIDELRVVARPDARGGRPVLEGSPGTLRASGRVLLDGLSPSDVDLDVVADGFWAAHTDEVATRVSGALSGRGPPPGMDVLGRVEVQHARIWLGDEVRRGLAPVELPPDFVLVDGGRRRAEAGAEGQGRAAAWLAALLREGRVAIDVSLARDVFVRLSAGLAERDTALGGTVNLLARVTPDLQVTGDLALRNSLGHAAIEGDLQVIRGDLSVLGRRFVIDRGEVLFTGSWPPDPRVDIVASRDSLYGKVSVQVEGPSSSPKVSFSSEGGRLEDEADIVAVLVAGRPLQELTTGQGEDIESQAASFFAGIATSLFGKALSRDVLDLVQVEQRNTAEGSSTQIELGRSFGRRVFVITRYRIAGEGEQDGENVIEGQVEVQLTPRLLVEGVIGDKGHGELLLRYLRRF